MRSERLMVLAAALAGAALLSTPAAGVPPKAGQVDISGEAMRSIDAKPDFAPADLLERNEFERALKIPEPAPRAAAFEAFVKRYPTSRAKRNALLQIARADAEAGAYEGLLDAAARIDAAYPDDVLAMAVVVDETRRAAIRASRSPLAPRLRQEAAADSTRGLSALAHWAQRPAAMPADRFKRARSDAEAIFERTLGWSSLLDKDYAAARIHLSRAAALDVSDWWTLEQLAAADLVGRPIEPVGFWYAAKASSLAKAEGDEASASAIDRFARAAYHRHHGGEDGWEQLRTAVQAQTAPPQGFTVAEQTPATLALKLAAGDLGALAFTDWETVLAARDASPDNHAAADRVWAHIQSEEGGGLVRLTLPAKVVFASSTMIACAVSDDARATNKPDVVADLATPIANPISSGAEIQLSGVIDSYTPQPFSFHLARARVEPK